MTKAHASTIFLARQLISAIGELEYLATRGEIGRVASGEVLERARVEAEELLEELVRESGFDQIDHPIRGVG